MAKTANEELLDASIRHQIHVLRFSEGEAKVAAKLLADSDAELMTLLAKELTEDGAASLNKTLYEIRRLRQNLAKQLSGVLQSDLDELAVAEADWEMAALEGSIPVQMSFSSVAPSLLKAVASTPISGVPLEGWLEKMSVNDISRIEQQVRLGVLEGNTIDQITRRLRGTKAMDFADGILKTTKREAEMIARTAVNHVSTAARQSVWDANADILEGLRWVSTLDGRTSDVCASRDGTVYPLDSGPRTPGHPNCRSTMAPVVKGEKIVGTRATVTDTRTRRQREIDFRAEAKTAAGSKWSSMSTSQRNEAIAFRRQNWINENIGSVPNKVNYQKWLEGQSEAFQNDVLGPGKAALFRQGVPLDKFVDANGKPYSLQDLKTSLAGDKLNVIQPGVGLKAKALLQQGLTPQETLAQILKEYPDAKTSAASIASYKSELNKAGALVMPSDAQIPKTAMKQAQSVQAVLEDLEAGLPSNVKHALGGQWATVVESLDGSPGAYGFYQAGKGVQLSGTKLAALPQVQTKQIAAHELGHLLHKQHDVKMIMTNAQIKIAVNGLSPDAKKLYSYYLSSPDELVAEIYAQALSPSVVTSQGLSAIEFNQAFSGYINAAKVNIAAKFPPAPVKAAFSAGPPVLPFEVAGKHTTVGSLSKALLQQGLPDEDVLKAVLAEFPNAKTKIASIKSYKSQLKSEGLLLNKAAGPTIVAKPIPVKPAPIAATTSATVNPPAFMTAPPSTIKLTGAKLKEKGLEAMKAGVLGNKEVVELLAKQFPQNAADLNMGKVATWKSLWKKANPAEFSAAEKLAKKGVKIAENTGPLVQPKLYGATLGPNSKKAYTKMMDVMAAGGTKDDAYAVMKSVFGSLQEPGATDLLELVKYDLATLKSMGKPYLSSVHVPTPQAAAPSISSQAPPMFHASPKPIQPGRPASRPRDGLPPPPRFIQADRQEALRHYGVGMAPGALSKVNTRQVQAGLQALSLEEVSAIKAYTGGLYRTLNGQLRSGHYSSNFHLQAFVESAQHGMMKMAKFKGLSSRGMTLGDSALKNLLSTYRKGAIIEDDAFISTSAGSEAAFTGNVYLKIQGKSGVDISYFSNFPGEREVLFMPGTRFQVDAIEQINGRYVIHMTEQ